MSWWRLNNPHWYRVSFEYHDTYEDWSRPVVVRDLTVVIENPSTGTVLRVRTGRDPATGEQARYGIGVTDGWLMLYTIDGNAPEAFSWEEVESDETQQPRLP